MQGCGISLEVVNGFGADWGRKTDPFLAKHPCRACRSGRIEMVRGCAGCIRTLQKGPFSGGRKSVCWSCRECVRGVSSQIIYMPRESLLWFCVLCRFFALTRWVCGWNVIACFFCSTNDIYIYIHIHMISHLVKQGVWRSFPSLSKH